MIAWSAAADMGAKTPLQRTERRAVFGALAAELGHDLQGLLNLLRMARARLTAGHALDAEELEAVGEEIERLADMSARLRTLVQGGEARGQVSARRLVESALEARAGRFIEQELVLELPAEAELYCDASLLGLALGELIDNALEARRTLAGVRYVAGISSGFCVWDDGAGFELDTAEAVGWGVSTKPQAAGLGLTLVLRVARAHGYRLEVLRHAERTEVWLLQPGSAAPP
jgi:signal transduction histidine kinase